MKACVRTLLNKAEITGGGEPDILPDKSSSGTENRIEDIDSGGQVTSRLIFVRKPEPCAAVTFTRRVIQKWTMLVKGRTKRECGEEP